MWGSTTDGGNSVQRFDKEIPDELRVELESKANVVGVGRGPKRTDEGRTDEEAIIVLVREKVPEEDLDESDLVPSTVTIQAEGEDEEVKTDVIETGDLYAFAQAPQEGQTGRTQQGQAERSQGGREQTRRGRQQAGRGQAVQEGRTTTGRPAAAPGAIEAPAMDRKGRWRPAAGGVSIGHQDVTAGTLGSSPLLTQDDEVAFLTNAHVAAPPGVQRGDPIIQPGRADGGSVPDDRIGSVLEWSTLSADRTNESDSALVAVDDATVENDLLGLDDLRGWSNARFDEPYYKSGRTTGVTSGELLARDVTANVNYRGDFPEPLTFAGLDVFSAMSTGGDSGSLIGRRKADGFYASDLLFAGSDQVTLGIPMNTVQQIHGTLEPITDEEMWPEEAGGLPSEGGLSGTDTGSRGGRAAGQPPGGARPVGSGGAGTAGGGAGTAGSGAGAGGRGGGTAGGARMVESGAGTAGGPGMAGAGRAAAGAQPAEAQAVGGLRDHFSGTLAPGETQHWVTWGWSPEYAPTYWAVPTNPNGRIETSMQVERAADDTLSYHVFVTNRSSVHTGFQAKFVVFS